MKALHWSTRLELVLAEPSALRVLETASIIQLAKNVRQDISKPSVERWIQQAVAANRLRRVVRGLFLNRLITPPPQLCEAAVWLRPGAVISLQTVLGDSGVWNNYTEWVTAVVPLSSRYATPSLGTVETGAGTFVFRGVPERVLETGAENDRLIAGVDYRRATPEAALLHWLYLSGSPRSRMSTPPLDLDLDALDLKRLKRLAIGMHLDANWTIWRDATSAKKLRCACCQSGAVFRNYSMWIAKLVGMQCERRVDREARSQGVEITTAQFDGQCDL